MSEFDRLRSLLLAEEREALARAQQRLDTLDEAREGLAESLPGLVRRAPPRRWGALSRLAILSALCRQKQERKRIALPSLPVIHQGSRLPNQLPAAGLLIWIMPAPAVTERQPIS